MRQRLWRLVIIGSITLGWLAASPAPSLACSCAAETVETDVVFVGRVILVVDGEWVRRLLTQNHSFGSTLALLDVELMWQGARRPFYAVVGGTGEENCSLHFVPGARYLIAGLHRGVGSLETNSCLGSRQMEPTQA